MNKEVFKKLISRDKSTNKYSFGHMLVIGGSPGMIGASLLCAEAGIRTGAGLVTIASSDYVIDKIEGKIKEILTLTCPNNVSEAIEIINNFIIHRRINSVVIGPGLNPNPHLLSSLINSNVPILIDAGGLATLIHHTQILSDRHNQKDIILTPHLGEFKRFYPNIPFNPDQIINLAKNFVNTNKVILVLKGHPTHIFKTEHIFEDKIGGPELATAGSGDVLSGIIGGLIAQGLDGLEAAKAGVYLHSIAGHLAAKDLTEPAVIASDIINYLPKAYAFVIKELND